MTPIPLICQNDTSTISNICKRCSCRGNREGLEFGFTSFETSSTLPTTGAVVGICRDHQIVSSTHIYVWGLSYPGGGGPPNPGGGVKGTPGGNPGGRKPGGALGIPGGANGIGGLAKAGGPAVAVKKVANEQRSFPIEFSKGQEGDMYAPGGIIPIPRPAGIPRPGPAGS